MFLCINVKVCLKPSQCWSTSVGQWLRSWILLLFETVQLFVTWYRFGYKSIYTQAHPQTSAPPVASQELEWWAWWTLINSFSDLFAMWIQTEICLFCSVSLLYAAYSCCLSSNTVYWRYMRNDEQQWKAKFSANQVKPNTQNVMVTSSDKSWNFSFLVALQTPLCTSTSFTCTNFASYLAKLLMEQHGSPVLGP